MDDLTLEAIPGSGIMKPGDGFFGGGDRSESLRSNISPSPFGSDIVLGPVRNKV